MQDSYLAKDWIVTTPNGEEIKVHNLHKFCKENELSYVMMNMLTRDNYKGWKCRKVEKEGGN